MMHAGAQTGLQSTLTQDVITFGRADGNALTIAAQEIAHLSRQHGRLELIQNQWILTNQSTNGTTVNGKKMRRDQQVLNSGDIVGVVKQPLFTIQFNAMDPYVPPIDEVDEDAEGQGSALSEAARKTKLWIRMGAMSAIAVGAVLIVVAAMMESGGKSNGPGPGIANWNKQQIQTEFEKPIVRPRDDAKAEIHLGNARQHFTSRDDTPSGNYRTLYHYKLHMAYLGLKQPEDPLDVNKYNTVLKNLSAKFVNKYRFATSKVAVKEWCVAVRSFRELRSMYPAESDSSLGKNIGQYISMTKKHCPRP
jgi:hypothetical protein